MTTTPAYEPTLISAHGQPLRLDIRGEAHLRICMSIHSVLFAECQGTQS